MLKFYYNTAPNPMKVALFLEESGLPYEAVPLDTRKGEQFTPDYLAINPNSKAPSIVDDGKLVNVKRHFAAINARPAADRAAAIKDRHAFKAEMDDEARRIMFRHTAA